MDFLLVYITSLLGLCVVEQILAATWTGWYLRTGIRLFTHRVPVEGKGSLPNTQSLNSIVSGRMECEVHFREVGPDAIAFQFGDRWPNVAMTGRVFARGIICNKSELGHIEVVGFLHWIVLLLPGMLMIALFYPPEGTLAGLAVSAFVLIFIFRPEYHKSSVEFQKIAEVVAERFEYQDAPRDSSIGYSNKDSAEKLMKVLDESGIQYRTVFRKNMVYVVWNKVDGAKVRSLIKNN